MLLILIIGFAFNGDELHDIKIGAVASDLSEVQPVLDNLASDEIEILKYGSIYPCILEMNQSKIHLCAVFSQDFSVSSESISGEITFYYDNSRYNLVRFILEYLKEQLSVTSDEISLEATSIILSDIEDFVDLMEDTQLKLGELKKEAFLLKRDLIVMRAKLEDIDNQFDPKYQQLKDLQEPLMDNIKILKKAKLSDNESQQIISYLTILNNQLTDLQTNSVTTYALLSTATSQYNTALQTISNASLISLNLSTIELSHIPFNETMDLITDTQKLIDKTVDNLNTTNFVLDSTEDYIDNLDTELNNIFLELDEISLFLDDSLLMLNTTIENIDTAIIEIDRITTELDENIEKFGVLDQESAEKLINPINSEFEPILGELPKINLIFPILLIFVITFISILLSNMVVLNELHSPSYFRNFLIPINNLYYIAGLFITNMIVTMIQIAVLLIVSYFNFGIDILSVFFDLSIAIISITTIFVLIGMFFAYLIRTKQTSILICTFFSLAVFLFSDVIFPVEIMPKSAAFFANLNPLLIGENVFRKIIFFDIGIFQQPTELILISAYILIMAGLTIAAYYVNKMKT